MEDEKISLSYRISKDQTLNVSGKIIRYALSLAQDTVNSVQLEILCDQALDIYDGRHLTGMRKCFVKLPTAGYVALRGCTGCVISHQAALVQPLPHSGVARGDSWAFEDTVKTRQYTVISATFYISRIYGLGEEAEMMADKLLEE